jgi:hypothetical protein
MPVESECVDKVGLPTLVADVAKVEVLLHDVLDHINAVPSVSRIAPRASSTIHPLFCAVTIGTKALCWVVMEGIVVSSDKMPLDLPFGIWIKSNDLIAGWNGACPTCHPTARILREAANK